MTEHEAREAVEDRIARGVWDALMQIDGWAALWVADQHIPKHPAITAALNTYRDEIRREVLAEQRCYRQQGVEEWGEPRSEDGDDSMTDETRDEDISAMMAACGGESWHRHGATNDPCITAEWMYADKRYLERRAAITHTLDREQERTLEAVLAGLRVCSCGASGVTVVNGQYETEYERCFIHRMLSEVRERMETSADA